MIEEVTGDLLASGLPALAHGCNCRGVMGAGIAVQFAARWPAMEREYARQCEEGKFRPGDVMTWHASPRNGTWVFNLATQDNPGPCASLEAIAASVTKMLGIARLLHVYRVGLPRIGCGIGGLKWGDVKDVLERCATGQVRLAVFTLPAKPEGK